MKLHELSVENELPAVTLAPVSRIDLIKYAGASGDYNPIHTVDDLAKKVGLPGVIAHGMWTMGNLSKLFTAYYDEGFISKYSIRFLSMVFLDDVVTLKAKVLHKEDQTITFHVQAVNQQEKTVIAGEIEFQTY